MERRKDQAPPANWQDFEDLCLKLWRPRLIDAKKNGRAGQPQAGVDIFGRDPKTEKWVGIQCKQRGQWPKKELTVGEIEAEVEQAESFEPPLSQFIVATTAPRDVKTQEFVRDFCDRRRANGGFSVDLFAWQDLQDWLQEEQEKSTLPPLDLPKAGEICPYRGLDVFDEEHERYFFGRQSRIASFVRLWEKKGRRVLALLGKQGSGKSSMLRAGALPALRKGALKGSESWHYAILRPGPRPVANLVNTLVTTVPSFSDRKPHLEEAILADPRVLCRELGALPRADESRLFLVIDPFDEIFSLCDSKSEQLSFLDALRLAILDPRGPLSVVLALRSELLDQLQPYSEFSALLAGNRMVLGNMTSEELREAIAEPAAQEGLAFESGLLDTLIADCSARGGSLPLMQHALLELWSQRRSGQLTWDAYNRIGGIAGALPKRAEQTLAELSSSEKAAARRILLRLVEPGLENTRRSARLEELEMPEQNRQEVELVVDHFARARLLTLTLDRHGGSPSVDVAHEVLIRNWSTLSGWVEQHRPMLLGLRRLRNLAEEWRRVGFSTDGLPRGEVLAEFEAWALEHPGEVGRTHREFLSTARDHERREVRRRAGARKLIAALALFAVTAFGFGIVSYLSSEEVRRSRDEARQQAERAERRTQALKLLNQALDLTDKPQRALLLGVASVRATEAHGYSLPEAESALRRLLEGVGGIPLIGHQGSVEALAFHPGGDLLASGGADGTVRLWRTEFSAPEHVATSEGGSSVNAIAFDKRSGRLASAHADGTVRLWPVIDPTEPHLEGPALLAPPGRARAEDSPGGNAEIANHQLPALQASDISFSPDGTRLAIGYEDGHLEIRDAVVAPFRVEQRRHVSTWDWGRILFSPDGSELVFADEGIGVWDLESGGPGALSRLSDADSVNELMFSADDERLIAVDEHGFRIWHYSAPDRPLLHAAEVNYGTEFAISPAGNWAAFEISVYSPDVSLVRIDDDDNPGYSLQGHEEMIMDLAFSPDGNTVATAGADGQIRLWRVEKPLAGREVIARRESGAAFPSRPDLSFSPDGRWLAGILGDRSAIAIPWPPGEGNSRPVDQEYAKAIAFAEDSTKLAVAGKGVQVHFLSGQARPPLILETEDSFFLSVAIAPDSRRLAAAGFGKIYLWDLERSVAPLKIFELLGHKPGRIAFSRNGNWLVAPTDDHGLRMVLPGGVPLPGYDMFLWPVEGESLEPIRIGGHQWSIPDLARSPDGQELATASWDRTVWLWDLSALDDPAHSDHRAEKLVAGRKFYTHDAELRQVRYSPAGRSLAVGAADGTLLFWESLDIDTPRELRFGDPALESLAFDPKGRWLASGTKEGEIQLWNLERLDESPVVLGYHRSVRALTFSPDGTELLSTGFDGQLLRWKTRIEDLLLLACRIAGRTFTDEERHLYFEDRPQVETCGLETGPSVAPP